MGGEEGIKLGKVNINKVSKWKILLIVVICILLPFYFLIKYVF